MRAIFLGHGEALFHPLPGLVLHCVYDFGGPHHLLKQLAGFLPHYPGVHLFSSFSPLGAVALAYALVRRRQGLLVVWCLGFLLYIQYGFSWLEWDGNGNTLHYYLITPVPRYLTGMLPALVLLCSELLCDLGRRNKTIATMVLLAIGATALFHVRGNYRFYRGSLADMRQAAAYLSSEPSVPVHSDPWGLSQLRFFSGERLTNLWDYPLDSSLPDGSFVVVGGSRGFDLATESLAAQLPPPFGDLHIDPDSAPAHWQLAFSVKGPHHASRTSDLAIFRVRASPHVP